jgi:uncharacterized membrane protein
MSKKKSEAFEAETQILVKARETLEKNSEDMDVLRKAYASICDEYERLLEEARFLTKVSDKLEIKLNKANEQLEAHNRQLSTEKELVETEMGKALKTNKKLREEKTGLDESRNRLQMILIIIIAVLLVIFVIFIWYGYQMNEEIDAKEKSLLQLKTKVESLEETTRIFEKERDSLAKLIPPPKTKRRETTKPVEEQPAPEGGLIYFF